jgi:polysaccharide pyruvyl transferase WcaK-like protein
VVHEDELPGDNDSFAMAEVSRVLPSSPEIIRPTGLLDVRRTIASSKVVIGSRMHACLNAISLGVPAVPLAYSDKFSPLMADLGLTDVTVDLRRSDHVAADAMKVMERPDLLDATSRAGRLARGRLDVAVAALRGLGD